MGRLSEKNIEGGIRTKPWRENTGLSIDQTVVEEAVKNLNLTTCPVCKEKLSNIDNFGNNLSTVSSTNKMERYCPKDNYIIELKTHQYFQNGEKTLLFMRILTNSKNFKVLAESGELVNISKYVDLLYWK